MPNVPVQVNCDFTGVTLASGQWSGQPAWTFTPALAPVQPGNNKITWTLTTVNTGQQNSVPAGYSAGFSTDGIQFKPSNSQPWEGTPQKQPDGTITANDNFRGLQTPVDFFYTTTVQLTPNQGTSGTPGTFAFDPEIQNEPGGNLVKAAVK